MKVIEQDEALAYLQTAKLPVAIAVYRKDGTMRDQEHGQRAGGATEADLIPGVSDRMLQDAMGHGDPRTKDRYRRQKQRNAATVVQLRQRAQKEGD